MSDESENMTEKYQAWPLPTAEQKEKAEASLAASSLHPVVRELALDLLRDCFEDEIAHLQLRLIRDAQAPRFESLKESHPEIYRDFIAARNGPHEVLLRNRRKRVAVLTALIEKSNDLDQV